MMKVPDGTLRILVQGAQRVATERYTQETPYLSAEITERPDTVAESPELTALTRNVQETFSRIVEAVPYLPEELQYAVANIDDPSALSHLIAGSLRLKTEEKQELLEETDVVERLRRLVQILARELEVISIGSEIQSQVQSELDKSQREYVLRQQLEAIREELGEFDEYDGGGQRAAPAARRRSRCPRTSAAGRPRAQAPASSCRRRRPSTASSARTSSGSPTCRGTRDRGQPRPRATRAESSTRTTTTSSRSRTASSSTWPSAS